MVMQDAEKANLLERNARMSKMMAPDSPWNNFEPDKLGPAVMQYVSSREPYFRRWSESWFSTFQFLFGNHNFKWSKRYGFAVDYDNMKGEANGQMRSYTNIARIAIESLTSMLYSNVPEWDAETINESSITGRKFKKIAERLLEGMYHNMQMDQDISAAAFVMATFGQCSLASRWNHIGGKIIEVNRYQQGPNALLSSYMAPNAYTQGLIEVPAPVVDTRGNPVLEHIFKPERTIDGKQVVDRIYAGTPCVDVLTPFEYDRDLGTTGMHKTRSVRIYRLMDYDQWLDEYSQVEGQTKYFNNIQPVFSNPQVYMFALRLFMRMQTVTPPDDSLGGSVGSGRLGSGLFKYKVAVVEHYDQPHPKKWPGGRRVVVSNGVCTHIAKPQYTTEKMDGWHPLSEAQWINCYPSSISSGPMQDVVKKNREINVKDSLMATAVRRNMGSQLLVKMGMGLDPHQLVGEPGMAHEVTDPFGARWLHDDMPIPPVLAQLRQQDKEDIYEQSGALEAQRGEPSAGATSGYQEKQREEREEKRLAPPRKNFRNMVAGAGEKILYALKAHAPRLDDYTVGYLMRTSAGEFTTDDVISFMTQPLPVGTQIRIVENSMAIKSKATEQATLAELAKGPAAMRISQDAKVLDKYLKSFDAEQFRDASSAHRDRVERENEAFLDMIKMGIHAEGVTKPIVIDEDDHIIHMAEHDEFLIRVWDQVRDNKEWLMEFYTHKEMHRLKDQEMQGMLLPGTAMSTGVMVQQGAQVPLPSIQTIYQKGIMDKQQAQQQPPQGQGGGQNPQPQAPKQAGAGPGPQPTDPAAPSQNTQPGAAQQQQKGPPNG